MKSLYIYRIYETGKCGKRIGIDNLLIKLRDEIKADLIEARSANGYVTINYEFDEPLNAEAVICHYNNIVKAIGNFSDKIGVELGIDFLVPACGTVVTPDSLVKKDECRECRKCPDGCATCTVVEDDPEDEWAEVKRLRDLTTKKEKGAAK